MQLQNILIKTLVEYFDVDAWAKTLADESEDPAYSLTFPETRPKDARAIGGGVVIPAYRRAESSEIKENLLDLSEQIQTYYYEGLTKQNVMFKDLYFRFGEAAHYLNVDDEIMLTTTKKKKKKKKKVKCCYVVIFLCKQKRVLK